MAAPLGVAFFSIPILINKLGIEIFGVLTLIWLIIGYLSFLEFGVGRAITSKVSKYKIIESKKFIGEIVGTGFFITLLAGVFGALTLFFFSEPLAAKWLKIDSIYVESAKKSFIFASMAIPATVLNAVANGTLEAYENFRIINIIKFFQGVLNYLIPLLFVVLFNAKIYDIVLALVVLRYVFLVFSLLAVNKVVEFEYLKFSKPMVFEILTFGYWVTISNVVASIMINADRFLISGILGVALISYYAVPMDALIRILIIPTAVAGVLFPRFTKLIVDKKLLNELFKRSLFFMVCIMMIICIIGIYFSFEALSIWLGEDFSKKSYQLSRVILIGVFFISIAQILFAYIQAFGEAKSTAIIHFCECLFYVPLLIYMLKEYDLLGAAIAWSFRAFVDSIALSLLSLWKYKNQHKYEMVLK